MKRYFYIALIGAICSASVTLFFIHSGKKWGRQKRTSQQFREISAYDALTFLTRSRAYPASDIPPDKIYNEYNRTKAVASTPSALAVSSWQPIGPQNIGGRTLALAINPLNPN